MKCKIYLICTARIKENKLFIKAVRLFERYKASIEYINEEQRRIVAKVNVYTFPKLINDITEYVDYISYEMKAVCTTKNFQKEKLKELGFKMISKKAPEVFVGIYKDRVFLLEVKKRNVHIKVGMRKEGIPNNPLPPSLFLFDGVTESEYKGALKTVQDFINYIYSKEAMKDSN